MILRHPGIAQVQSDIHTASVDSKIPFGRTHRNYTAGRFQRGLFCFWLEFQRYFGISLAASFAFLA
jgi:hypothetical protein